MSNSGPQYLWTFLIASAALVATGLADEPANRWEKEIGEFEAQDRKSPPDKEGVVFLGSSSIRLWKLDESFPCGKYLNRGFGGSQLADSVQFVDRLVIRHRPRVVVVYAGDNDIANGKTPSQVASDFQSLAQRIHAKLPTTKVLYVAIKPSLARWKFIDSIRAANEAIARLCRHDSRLCFVDIFPSMLGDDGQPRGELLAEDGLHLSPDGYKLWTALVKPHIDAARE